MKRIATYHHGCPAVFKQKSALFHPGHIRDHAVDTEI